MWGGGAESEGGYREREGVGTQSERENTELKLEL